MLHSPAIKRVRARDRTRVRIPGCCVGQVCRAAVWSRMEFLWSNDTRTPSCSPAVGRIILVKTFLMRNARTHTCMQECMHTRKSMHNCICIPRTRTFRMQNGCDSHAVILQVFLHYLSERRSDCSRIRAARHLFLKICSTQSVRM